MNLWQRTITSLLVLLVLWISFQAMRSPDWRDKTLGVIVAIVYISIGVYYAIRHFRKN